MFKGGALIKSGCAQEGLSLSCAKKVFRIGSVLAARCPRPPRPQPCHVAQRWASCLPADASQSASHGEEGSNCAYIAQSCKWTRFQETIKQCSFEVLVKKKENLGRIFLGLELFMKFRFKVKCVQATSAARQSQAAHSDVDLGL